MVYRLKVGSVLHDDDHFSSAEFFFGASAMKCFSTQFEIIVKISENELNQKSFYLAVYRKKMM